MTVYLGRQNVSVGIVTKVGDNIKNEDIVVKENGVYNASEGYTGLGTVTVDVEGIGNGSIIEVVNKTGSTITAGSKVWLNENQQTQGSSYQIGTEGNYAGYKMGAIDRTGLFGVYYGKFYNIGEDSADSVADVPNDSYLAINRIIYMADNSVFGSSSYSYRFDGKAQWYSKDMHCIADNWFSNNRGTKVYQVNMSNGEIINTFTNSNEMVTDEPVKIGDYIYRLHGDRAKYKWLINYDTLTLTRSGYTFTNAPYQYDLIPAGVTADNKYILCSQDDPAYCIGGTYLYMVEVLEDGNLKGLSQSEMPVDMQKWYSTKCGYVFNPYTGILTVYESEGADYGIYRYEGNGNWTQLPIDLGTTEETKFCAPITVSDDLSRACYTHFTNYDEQIKASVIVNLTTTQGYAAVPYKFYNVTENTITGYAYASGNADDTIEVSIANKI